MDGAADDLLRHADMAMYRAKARGHGCWEVHDPRVPDPAVDRLRLLDELRTGLAHNQALAAWPARRATSDRTDSAAANINSTRERNTAASPHPLSRYPTRSP